MKNRLLCGLVLVGTLLCGAWWWFYPSDEAGGEKIVLSPGAGEPKNKPSQRLMETAEKPRLDANYGQIPLYFIENRGQVDSQVEYYSKGAGHTTFFTRKGVVMTLFRGGNEDRSDSVPPGLGAEHSAREEGPRPAQYSVVRMQPVGMKKNVKIKALQPQKGKINYIIGNDPKKWRLRIPTYEAVVYEDAYPGVDLKFYGAGRELEYDVVVKPGADPGLVRFAYEGVKELRVTAAGDLALVLPDGGELIQKKPVVYQEIAGERVLREGKFLISRDTARLNCGFQVAAYDRARPLVIDPVLVYSSYLGGWYHEIGYGIAVDPKGNAYITGYTESFNFPTRNPFQGAIGGNIDAFVTKVTAAGTLDYSTFLGGTYIDKGYGIAADSEGNAYITGETGSTDFPALNPYKKPLGVFVTKLTTAGALTYSTGLGGASSGRGVAVDLEGNAYITGYTDSPGFPTLNPIQATLQGGKDVFITKLTAAGNALVYSTYLGGSNSDYGCGIAVDPQGNAYITGYTWSPNFPTQNPFQGTKTNINYTAFVIKLTAAGNALVYSTYLGGNTDDYGYGIATDSEGNAYITGYTRSTDFPTLNPIRDKIKGYTDAFVTKLTAAGNALVYSTYLGGSFIDYGHGIAADSEGNAYITGYTRSRDFPTLDAFQGVMKGDPSVFVTKLATGGALAYSTYLGGAGDNYGYGIALDPEGNAYVTGSTTAKDFPTRRPFQEKLGRSFNPDSFVSKIGKMKTKFLIFLPEILLD